MKVFVTKYALTRGIIEAETDETMTEMARRATGNNSWIVVRGISTWFKMETGCCATLFTAVARAEEMRTAKIASLKKQIARLSALKWEVE